MVKTSSLGFFGGLVIKNLPANARDASSTLGSGGLPEEGKGNPLLYSCLGKPMDRLQILDPGGLQSIVWQRVRHDLATKQQQQSNCCYFCPLDGLLARIHVGQYICQSFQS